MAAYSLAEYKQFMKTGISPVIIDEIMKRDLLLQLLPFTDNGTQMKGKWIYSYNRREGQLNANIRTVGNEYTTQKALAPTAYTVELSIMGGSYPIDRSQKDAGDIVSIIAENEQQLIQAVRAKFSDLMINGDTNNAGEFDGLDVNLAGGTTEWGVADYVDLSSQAAIEANAKAFRYGMNQWLAKLIRKPDALVVDDTFLPVFTEIAQILGGYSTTTDSFGNTVENYRGIPLIAAGEKAGSSAKIIGTETRTVGGSSVTGLTDIYGVCFGPQEFHGVAPDNGQLIQTFRPDFATAGAVKIGEVEMIATIALEHTRAAGVFRNLKME